MLGWMVVLGRLPVKSSVGSVALADSGRGRPALLHSGSEAEDLVDESPLGRHVDRWCGTHLPLGQHRHSLDAGGHRPAPPPSAGGCRRQAPRGAGDDWRAQTRAPGWEFRQAGLVDPEKLPTGLGLQLLIDEKAGDGLGLGKPLSAEDTPGGLGRRRKREDPVTPRLDCLTVSCIKVVLPAPATSRMAITWLREPSTWRIAARSLPRRSPGRWCALGRRAGVQLPRVARTKLIVAFSLVSRAGVVT